MTAISKPAQSKSNRDQWARLKTALDQPGARLPDDVRRWLLEAAREYDGSVPLDILLGLRGPGIRTLATINAIHTRDFHLWVAWYEYSHGGNPQCPVRKRNEIFRERIRLFRRRLPRINQRNDLDPLDRHLFDAHQASPLPSNDRHLLDIAKGFRPGMICR
ncbi:MAG: hypothetical protein WCY71_00010 [Halothiobacillaceae bacterium]